jgi:hypothetical protein
MTEPGEVVRWRHGGWSGRMRLAPGVNPATLVGAATTTDGARQSRHARTLALDTARGERLWLKWYPPPDGRRARRAARMCMALARAGIGAPEVVLVGRRAAEGLLVTCDVGGRGLVDVVATSERAGKRAWLRRLGTAVGRLHASGFVHGDLVPSNVLARGQDFFFLDHDRTRRSAALVWWHGRRNLVQLGRFVVRGIGLTDRVRVLRAYADARGLSRRARRRLARWLAAKTIARRCAIDAIPLDVAARAGFAAVMRSGGPFDGAGGAVGGAR